MALHLLPFGVSVTALTTSPLAFSQAIVTGQLGETGTALISARLQAGGLTTVAQAIDTIQRDGAGHSAQDFFRLVDREIHGIRGLLGISQTLRHVPVHRWKGLSPPEALGRRPAAEVVNRLRLQMNPDGRVMAVSDGSPAGPPAGSRGRVAKRFEEIPPDASTGDLLVRESQITRENLAAAMAHARRYGGSLSKSLLEMGMIDEEQLVEFISQHHGVPVMNLDDIESPDSDVLHLLQREFCERYRVVPIGQNQKDFVVAFANPGDVGVQDEIRSLTGYNIVMVVASEPAIRRAIAKFYGALETATRQAALRERVSELAASAEVAVPSEDILSVAQLTASAEGEPVVELVNLALVDAVMRGASDIHVEPYANKFRVRFRLDGVLRTVETPPIAYHRAVVSRLKILAGLKIDERRMPQDGRIRLRLADGRVCDFRVSVIPVQYGEKVVLRLLDPAALQTDMTRLGFEPADLEIFLEAIHQPQGMVLVTGPTGSGKTTTLYSALAELNKGTKNISTAEDPIEYELGGLNQVQMNDPIGLNFSLALRAFLRQDPDIIMVGEIRDYETGEVAIKAAQTGHMVLSTLHTNDAPSTVTRLLDLGFPPYLLTDTLTLIVAQRLLRRVCESCGVEQRCEQEACLAAGMTADEFAVAGTRFGRGCEACNGTGYKGRIAIYELMKLSKPLKEAIRTSASTDELKRLAVRGGMQTLRRAALAKFAQGFTTLEEVLRVTSAD